MDERAFGLSNAYTVRCAAGGQLPAEEAGRRLFGPLLSGGQEGLGGEVLLRNGARVHVDVPGHPDYATPECGDVPELVVRDKAGERILEGLLEEAVQRLREEGIAQDVFLLKADTDPAGNGFGCREDYRVGRGREFGRLPAS